LLILSEFPEPFSFPLNALPGSFLEPDELLGPKIFSPTFGGVQPLSFFVNPGYDLTSLFFSSLRVATSRGVPLLPFGVIRQVHYLKYQSVTGRASLSIFPFRLPLD